MKSKIETKQETVVATSFNEGDNHPTNQSYWSLQQKISHVLMAHASEGYTELADLEFKYKRSGSGLLYTARIVTRKDE